MRLDLTPRQVAVCALLADGLSSKEAAQKLGMSRVAVSACMQRARDRNGGLNTNALMYQLGLLMGRNGVR
jgi:DNA-binding CsgD family transcriptional regulator